MEQRKRTIYEDLRDDPAWRLILDHVKQACKGVLTSDACYRFARSFYRDNGIYLDPNALPIHAALLFTLAKGEPNYPTWVLTKETAAVLRDTQLPYSGGVMGATEELPHDCLYIEVPRGTAILVDPESGDHQLEGIFLVRDSAEDVDGTKRSAWIVLGIGEDKSGVKPNIASPALHRDDAMVYCGLTEGKNLHELLNSDIRGLKEVLHIALNLEYAWRTRHLRTQEVRPTPPKSGKKQKRAERRGVSHHPYRVIDLRGVAPTREVGERTRSGGEYHGSRVIVPGH